MASKKLKKALGAALVGFGAAKAMDMMGARKAALKKAASVTTDPDTGSEMGNDTMLSKAMSSVMLGKKSKLPKKKPSMGKSMSDLGSTFGLGPYDGAKKGKMINASGGTMVTARGVKMGYNKATKIT
jgi:hypothetical protein